MANLSSVITQTVGTSVAGVNLITAPNESSIWTATTISKSTTNTAAELPLGPAIPTATKFALAASAGSAYCDFDCPNSLLNTKQGLGWFSRASSGFTATISLTLQSFASSADRTSGTSPTTISLQSSAPTGTAASFFTSFDTNSQQYYRLTINFTGQSSAWYSICQVQVGPGERAQGAAVGDWVSYSPTVTGITVGSGTLSAFYRRVGSDIEVNVKFTLGAGSAVSSVPIIPLPTGLTVNSSILTTTNGPAVGYSSVNDAGTNTYPGTVLYLASNAFYVYPYDDAASGVVLLSITSTVPFTWISGDGFSAYFKAPIAEWAGNGTVNLGAAAQLQYIADDGSSDVFGPNGALVPNVAFGTGATTRNLSIPAQASGQQLTVEINYRGSGWNNAADLFPFSSGNNNNANNAYGIQSFWTNSTTFTVGFGNRGTSVSTSLADNGGTSWATEYAAGTRYRVVVANPSSPVGFGLANSNESGLVKPRKGQTSLTVTGSGWTTSRAVGIYYQDQDGNHRFKFNIIGNVSASVRVSYTVSVSGVTFKSGSYQAIAWWTDTGVTPYQGYPGLGTSDISFQHSSSSTSIYAMSGDVELESKPTWA